MKVLQRIICFVNNTLVSLKRDGDMLPRIKSQSQDNKAQ